MNSTEMLKIVVKSIDDKKGCDIKVIKIADISSIADYFVFASGTSTTQVRTIADEVEEKLRAAGIGAERSKGHRSADWAALDYGDIIVHVFSKETREFYDLERLWQDGESIDPAQFL